MKNNVLPIFLLSAFLVLIGSLAQLFGQTNTWDGSSSANWNTAANWSLNSVPSIAHDVVIPNGITSTINVNTAAVCKSFTMNSGNTANTVSINTGNSLTVTGAVTINNTTASAKILAVGAGSLACASIAMSNTSSNSDDCRVTISTGTVNVSGNITMNGSAARNQVDFSGAGTLNLGGSISGGDLISATGSTVNYNGSSAQTVAINSDYVYTNLHINNTAGATLQAAITTTNVTGNIRIQTGSLSNGGFEIAGVSADNFEVANGATFILTGTSSMATGFTKTFGLTSTVDYAGGNQTISPESYGHLIVTAGSKTISSDVTVTVNGNLTNSGTITMTAGTSATNTWLAMAGNVTNNPTGTINATANYTRFIFSSSIAQTFTNYGTMTSPVASFDVANSHASGLTLAGSNSIIVTRANLFYGTVTNSNKITLGTGGTSWAVVQRGMDASTSAAGTFDVAPTFNIGTGGYYLLYDYGTINFTADKEIPSSETVNTVILFPTTAVTITLAKNLTITDELTFYGGNVGTLDIGAHTLTVNGVINYAGGTLQGGTSSNITLGGSKSITLPAVTNNLNNLTIDNTIGAILGSALTVNGTLTLSNGLLVNGSNLTLATGSTISRSGGYFSAVPTFAGTVNLNYTGGASISTAKELPTSSSVLYNLITNTGGTLQNGIPTGTVSTSYSQGFNTTANPSDWTTEVVYNPASPAPAITYVTSAGSSNPSVTPTEGTRCVEFNSYTCDAGDQIRLKKSSSPLSTTGKTNITVVFDWYMDNTYTNLDNVTVEWSTNGTSWNSSFIYYRYSATNGWVTVNCLLPQGAENQTALYVALLFTGDYGNNCHLDNFKVNITTPGTPTASTATVNGTLNLTNGTYAIGSGNSLVLNGGISGSNAIIGSTTSNMTVGGSGANLILPDITNGLNNFTITRLNGVSIASTKSLTVTGALSNSAGINGLRIKSDASGTGSLISSTTGVDATVERFLTKMKWHFIGMPTESGTANSFHLPSGHSDIYLRTHIESTNLFGPYIVPVTTPLIQGRGYETWVGNTGFNQDETIIFPGKLNAGNYTTGTGSFYPLEYSTGHGLNLICNPYPSALNGNIHTWTKTNISNKVYVWDPSYGNYRYWNGTSGTPSPYAGYGTLTSGIIPEMQAFFVEATGSSPSLTIPQSSRVHSSQVYYKDSEIPLNTLRFDITGNGYEDAIFISFNELSTQGYDTDYDVEKLYGLDEAPQLFSEITDKKLSINSLPSFDESLIIPIGFECGVSSTFTMTASGIEGFDQGVEFYLEDLKEGTVQNLIENPVYSFVNEPLDDASRYLLHFTNPSAIDDHLVNEVRIYSESNEIHILNLSAGNSLLFIYDLMGRMVTEKQLHANDVVVVNVNTGTGYYLVKVDTGDKVVTQKVFIR